MTKQKGIDLHTLGCQLLEFAHVMSCCGGGKDRKEADGFEIEFEPIIEDKRITLEDGDGDIIDFKIIEGRCTFGQKSMQQLHLEMTVNGKKLCDGQAVEYLQWDPQTRLLKDPDNCMAPIPAKFDESKLRLLTERWNPTMVKPCRWLVKQHQAGDKKKFQGNDIDPVSTPLKAPQSLALPYRKTSNQCITIRA